MVRVAVEVGQGWFSKAGDLDRSSRIPSSRPKSTGHWGRARRARWTQAAMNNQVVYCSAQKGVQSAQRMGFVKGGNKNRTAVSQKPAKIGCHCPVSGSKFRAKQTQKTKAVPIVDGQVWCVHRTSRDFHCHLCQPHVEGRVLALSFPLRSGIVRRR